MGEITFGKAFLKPKIIKLKNDYSRVAKVKGKRIRKFR